MYDNLVISHMTLNELRSLVSNKTGLPVGVFRLVTENGREMYDGHCLEEYGIDVGCTVCLQSIDGWNDIINLCVMGYTPQVKPKISLFKLCVLITCFIINVFYSQVHK